MHCFLQTCQHINMHFPCAASPYGVLLVFLQAENTACMCRVRKSHSDTALSALEPDSADKPSAPTALNADGLPAASSQQAVQPLTGLAEQPDAAAAPQVI